MTDTSGPLSSYQQLLSRFDPAFFDEAFFRGGKGSKRDEDSETYRELAGIVRELFGGEGLRFLDVGCGRGFVVWHLQQAGETAEGIDVSQWAIANPVTEGLHEWDVLSLPMGCKLLGGPWDVVIADRVIEYLPVEDVGPALRALTTCGRGLYLGVLSTDHERYDAFSLADHLAWGRRTFRSRAWWQRTIAASGWVVDEARQARLQTMKPDWLDSWVLVNNAVA